MNTFKAIFLTFLISLISCKENNTRERKIVSESQNDTTEILHKFIEVSKDLNDNYKAEYKYLLNNKRKDSFLNEVRVYKNGILDTLKSRFYDLKVIKHNGVNHSGRVFYRNYLDTLDLEINKQRWVILYLEQQITKDSIAHEIFFSNDGNNIYYEYSDFDNGRISGYIVDTALIPLNKKDSLGEEITRHIEQPMNIQDQIKLN